MSEKNSKECFLSDVETFKLPVLLTVRSDFLLIENLVLYNGKKIALLQRGLVKLLFGTDWYGKEFRLNTYEQSNLHVDVVETFYPNSLEEIKKLLPNITYILSKPQYDYNVVASSYCEELKFSTDESFNNINDIILTTIHDTKISVSLDSLLNKEYFVFVVLKEKISLQMLLIKNVFPQTVRFLNSLNYQLPDGIAILQNVHVYDTVVTVTKNQPCEGKLTYEMFQLNSKIKVSILKKEKPKYLLSFGDYHTKCYRDKIDELKKKMNFNIYSTQFYGVFIEETFVQKILTPTYTKISESVNRVSTPKFTFLKKSKPCKSFISEDDETIIEASFDSSENFNLSTENDNLLAQNGQLSNENSHGKRRMAIKKRFSDQVNPIHDKNLFNNELTMFPLRKDKTQRLSQSENNLVTASSNTLDKSLDETMLSRIIAKQNSINRSSFKVNILKGEKNERYTQLMKKETYNNDTIKSVDSNAKLECEAEEKQINHNSPLNQELVSGGKKQSETSSNQEKYTIHLKRSDYKAIRKTKCKSESFLNESVDSLNTYYASLIYSDVHKSRIFLNELQMREIYSIEEIKSFTIKQVGKVLKKLNLSKYKCMFKKQLINGRLLINLSEEALREMKLTHFEARKLYKYVHGWRVKENNSSLNSTVNQWSVNDVLTAINKINLKKLSMFISDNHVDGSLLKDIIENGIIKTLEKDYGIHLYLVEQERLLAYINNSSMYEESENSITV